jgi:hypothetical protein
MLVTYIIVVIAEIITEKDTANKMLESVPKTPVHANNKVSELF